jgi:hypothetical protein
MNCEVCGCKQSSNLRHYPDIYVEGVWLRKTTNSHRVVNLLVGWYLPNTIWKHYSTIGYILSKDSSLIVYDIMHFGYRY